MAKTLKMMKNEKKSKIEKKLTKPLAKTNNENSKICLEIIKAHFFVRKVSFCAKDLI